MTKRQFVVLVFRLFALYFTFNLVESLGTFISASRIEGSAGLVVVLFAVSIALFFVSLLWRKSEWLMEKIFAIPSLQDRSAESSNEEAESEIEIVDYYETPISAESLQLLAFALFGMHEVLNSTPQFLRELWLTATEGALHTFSFDSLLPMLFQFFVGLWLLLRPWQLQDFLARFKRPEEAEHSEA